MRTKMSPRRALATALVMAVFPICLFLGGTSRYSGHICDQLLENMESTTLQQKIELQSECKKTVKRLNWSVFYWVLFSSILINWPIIRWLDDRQWYREWIKKEELK